MQSYGGLPALIFLSRMSARAMVGRKLSQSMIFSRSRQSPSSLNFQISSANREICFMLEPSFLVLPLLYHVLLFMAIDGEYLEVPKNQIFWIVPQLALQMCYKKAELQSKKHKKTSFLKKFALPERICNAFVTRGMVKYRKAKSFLKS